MLKKIFLRTPPWMARHWRFLIPIFLGITLIGCFLAFAIPKNEIRIVVRASSMEENGSTPKSKKLQELSEALLQHGVQLVFIKQPTNSESADLEFLVKNNLADIAVTPNTGASFSSEITENFSSMGVIGRAGIFFLAKSKNTDIKKLSELRGKKLIFWSSAENGNNPAFTSSDFKASPYSSDYIVEQLFTAADINASNTKLINHWPNRIKFSDDWDIWMAFATPGVVSRDSMSHAMYDELISGKVKFLNLNDLQGASKIMRFLGYQTLPASTVSLANAVPNTDVPYLSTTVSVIVRNDLDPSLIYALADALRKVYSQASLLAHKDEFPNFDTEESFAPNQHAVRIYKNEAPFLIDYLSPSTYTAVTKLITLAIPLLTIFWPLMHFLPKVYKFYVKHKITDWYKDLELIEKKYPTASAEERSQLETQLERVQDGLTIMKLPIMHLHYAQEIFAAKAHVDLIRRRIAAIKEETYSP